MIWEDTTKTKQSLPFEGLRSDSFIELNHVCLWTLGVPHMHIVHMHVLHWVNFYEFPNQQCWWSTHAIWLLVNNVGVLHMQIVHMQVFSWVTMFACELCGNL